LTNNKVSTERMPIRPGEKYHESLISKDEIRNIFELEKDYVLFDKQMQNYDLKSKPYKKTSLINGYSSDKVELLTKEEIKEILINENLIPYQFISSKH
jgi:UDP-N-acetylglucosamine 4,6-dehydratase/UDP-glucose 4-epimerase